MKAYRYQLATGANYFWLFTVLSAGGEAARGFKQQRDRR
jgi:hypothetical protein